VYYNLGFRYITRASQSTSVRYVHWNFNAEFRRNVLVRFYLIAEYVNDAVCTANCTCKPTTANFQQPKQQTLKFHTQSLSVYPLCDIYRFANRSEQDRVSSKTRGTDRSSETKIIIAADEIKRGRAAIASTNVKRQLRRSRPLNGTEERRGGGSL